MSSRKGTKGLLDGLEGLGSLADLEGGGFARLAALEGPAHAATVEVADPTLALGLDYDALTNEEVATAETSAVLDAFKARASAEQSRFALATDSEYWVGLCFQTRAQKEHFLREAKLLQHGDKYLDGQLLAKRMGIALPAADVPYNVSAKVDAKYAALVKEDAK